jgi:hypothetical protein
MRASEVIEGALVVVEDGELRPCLCDLLWGEAAGFLSVVTDRDCYVGLPVRSKRFTFRQALLAAASLARSEEEVS